MWPELIGPIATGLAGLVAAIAGLLTVRSQRISAQLEECRRELEATEAEGEDYRGVALLALRHIFRLETMLANRGVSPPARPDGLRV